MVIDRECRCRAFPWPHEFGVSDCGDLLAKREREEDAPESVTEPDTRYLDDPRRNQAAGLNALRRMP